MSFYLDDHFDDDRPSSSQLCPLCRSADFYHDPVTGALTCASCYTQSQTATQEELDYDDGAALAAAAGRRKTLGGRRGRGGVGTEKVARPLSEYDRSKRLPDAESCCMAFQWLLRDASTRVSELAGIREENTSGFGGFYPSEEGAPGPLERTVKKIWFAYLQAWTEAAREYSALYPEMRTSLRDYFLEDIRKGHLMRHLSVTVGRRVEKELVEELQRKERAKPYYHSQGEDDESTAVMEGGSSSSDGGSDNESAGNSSRGRKRKRPPVLTVAQLCQYFPRNPQRHPNGLYQMHPHQAALKIQPSMTLLLSILQLALTHLRTGVAPHHLTMWVASGQLPHALNGYALLPTALKERVEVAKKFFATSFVPPAGAVADLADFLATACKWYKHDMSENAPDRPSLKRPSLASLASMSPKRGATDDSVGSSKVDANANKPIHQRSLYNVPLLVARMVQDFGFGQRVLDNTLALIGVEKRHTDGDMRVHHSDNSANSLNVAVDQNNNNQSTPRTLLPPLACAAACKLHTPLHVAAVIVVACKLCPGWEMWKITNLHATVNAKSSDSKLSSSTAFVPWNESQFQLLGNGPTLNKYVDFLEGTAFSGIEPLANATQYFQSLETGMSSLPSLEKEVSRAKTKPHPSDEKITPNVILAGGPNPNEHDDVSKTAKSSSLDYQQVNNVGRYTSYTYQKNASGNTLNTKPYHPHYCRLLEYICYIIEETNTAKLHNIVEELEEELLSNPDDTTRTMERSGS